MPCRTLVAAADCRRIALEVELRISARVVGEGFGPCARFACSRILVHCRICIDCRKALGGMSTCHSHIASRTLLSSSARSEEEVTVEPVQEEELVWDNECSTV